ncbi:MAG: TIGR03084 family metal-binding protein [Rhizobiaceae bacterium]
MMQQAIDFKDESDVLHALVRDLEDADFERTTQFKQWTVNDVLVHLHFWNKAADQSLNDPDGFAGLFAELGQSLATGTLRGFENAKITARGRKLVDEWSALYTDMGERWKDLDPKHRVKWAGPEMSVRSSATARQMETWSHGQEVFDLFGQTRVEHDRIKNIVVLGVNTYAWSFKVRGMQAPDPMPFVKLTAPSGAEWTFGEDGSSSGSITGSAVGFCQIVTQTRNTADTDIVTDGEGAELWMKHAQCFAGPPETPPAPGSRGIAG